MTHTIWNNLAEARQMNEISDMESESIAETVFDNLEIFRGLNSREIRQLLRASEPVSFSAGETLFDEGDPADAMYLVESGELEVRTSSGVDDDVVLAQLGAGSVVGEMSILEGDTKRSASVIALCDVQAFRLTREAFQKLRVVRNRAAYRLILNLAEILADRRRKSDARLNEVFSDPASHIDEFEAQVHDLLARMHKV